MRSRRNTPFVFLVGGDHIAAAFRGCPHRGNQAHSRVKVLGQHLLQRFRVQTAGGIDPVKRCVQQLRRQAEAAGHHFRFVARFADGEASVGLEEVDSAHPFYHLEGSNNIILLTTERYKDYPMMIKGYGAGASVTAAGVFANIMSIANI